MIQSTERCTNRHTILLEFSDVSSLSVHLSALSSRTIPTSLIRTLQHTLHAWSMHTHHPTISFTPDCVVQLPAASSRTLHPCHSDFGVLLDGLLRWGIARERGDLDSADASKEFAQVKVGTFDRVWILELVWPFIFWPSYLPPSISLNGERLLPQPESVVQCNATGIDHLIDSNIPTSLICWVREFDCEVRTCNCERRDSELLFVLSIEAYHQDAVKSGLLLYVILCSDPAESPSRIGGQVQTSFWRPRLTTSTPAGMAHVSFAPHS